MIGRPPIEITDEVCRKVEKLAAQGLTHEQIALILGMGESTLYKKKTQFIEFLEAIKRGQAKGVGVITNKLFKKARDGDNTSMIFYLKNRAGWKDKQEIEYSGDMPNNGGICRASEILREFRASRQGDSVEGDVPD